MKKGVILAGGTGSRLYPLTSVVNKHLLPIGPYPMIYYPIASLIKGGILEVMIISTKEDLGDIACLLGSGEDLGCSFSFRVQDRPTGIAGALYQAKDFARGEPIAVILGDNIFLEDLSPSIEEFWEGEGGAMVFLKEVLNPREYGIAVMEGDTITDIKEKPRDPKSSLCVTGIYFYDRRVFSIIEGLTPSKRGELEITDVNRAYLKGGTLSYKVLSGFWLDAGTFPSLQEAGKYFHGKELSPFKGVRSCL